MESAMNTVVSIHLSHMCKCSELLTVYGSVQIKKKKKCNGFVFCVSAYIGEDVEEFCKDSLMVSSNLGFLGNK